MKNLSKITPLLLLSASLLFSCKRDNSTEPDNDSPNYRTASEAMEVQSEVDDAYQASTVAMDSVSKGVTTYSYGCATVAADTTGNQIVIDFGTTPCAGIDGRDRSGKIIINYIGKYRDPGSSFSTTFEDYTIEGNSLSGSFSVSAFTRNGSGQLYFTTSVTSAVLTYDDGTTITYSGTKTYTWISGEGTGDLFDDVYAITGNSAGANTSGESYASNITNTIELNSACWNSKILYPVAGTIEIEIPGASTMTLDFGDGTCDKKITITYKGRTYNYTLR